MATNFGYLAEPAYVYSEGYPAWWFYVGVDGDAVGRALQEHGAQLTNLAAYIDNGALRFTALMEPASSAWWWYYGQTAEQVSQLLAQNSAMLTDISPYIDVDNTLKFACIMVPQDRASWWYAGRTAEQVSQLLQQNSAMLTDISPYIDVDNSFKFVVNMVPADRAWWWYHGQTADQVQKLLQQNSARLTDACAYSDSWVNSNPVVKFAVIMDSKLGHVSTEIGAGLKIDELIQSLQLYFSSNNRLTRISPYHLVPNTGGHPY